MGTGWEYRLVSVLGVTLLTAGAVLLANHPLLQFAFTTYVPVFDRLDVTILEGGSLTVAVGLSVLAVGGSLVPLYKPRPRRSIDVVLLTQKRILVGGLALATLGYFQWSHRLPRATLVMTVGLLLVAIPGWFVWIRRRPTNDPDRTVIVGDDRDRIERIAPSVPAGVLGYLCPSSEADRDANDPTADGGVDVATAGDELDAPARDDAPPTSTPDGDDGADVSTGDGAEIDASKRLGGLSRLETVFTAYDVDTAVLAFRRADRAEFFGALDSCHRHGVDAKVHREYADCVLVSAGGVGDLVDVDVEPWDPFDHLFKRGFDVAFAVVGLLVFAPVVVAIALAIRLEDGGPVLYSQERTAGFGETFPVYKFRTMVPEEESARPSAEADNDRITRVGRRLRETHLDELPQLWSILMGDMSVVGPRAVWTEEEAFLEAETRAWRKRWFVKPGLTGLAQVRGAKSTDPDAKLRSDLEYIRRQSFRLDVKIVLVQVWTVLSELVDDVRR